MKKYILGLALLTSMSAFASLSLSSSAGDQYLGTDLVSNKPCTLEITKLKKDKRGNLKVYIELTLNKSNISSILSDVGVSFRGEEPGIRGERLFSNLFVKKNGTPESFDISEFNSEETVLTCAGLKKIN